MAADQTQANLQAHLRCGVVKVTFTKTDGTQRVMRCTTSPDIVPPPPVTESSRPQRKENADVCVVYDVDVKGWRSFRWASIITAEREAS